MSFQIFVVGEDDGYIIFVGDPCAWYSTLCVISA